MAEDQQLNPNIKKTLDLAARCAAAETSDNYGALEDQVLLLEGLARETFQSKLNFASLLPKLEQGKPLTAEDLKTLELLIVGDAEHYLKYETELDHWKSEIARLFGEIAKLQAAPMDVEALMDLRALCREAARILPDLVFYFEQKERATKFQNATKGPIGPADSRALSDIVKHMLTSDKM